ncbi:hypothetical protein FACS189456_3430 [Bacteroidia bacterium]|nr:hypothetical protein FACS189456_3430 [Bacteroidia bacterium]
MPNIKNMPQEEVHIGNLIRNRLKADGRSASWLAEQINCDRSNMYRIFKNNHIDTVLRVTLSFV